MEQQHSIDKYPKLAMVLGWTTPPPKSVIRSFTVNDIQSSLKKIMDAQRKFELASAKEDDFWKSSEQKRALDETNKQLKLLNEKLNRMLSIGF